MKATLALEDGKIFTGEAFGAQGEAGGEVVFNTSLSGYQEVLTDPSYAGQIVVMTSPLIGNYGINDEDNESEKIHLKGFIMKEASRITSNFRSQKELELFLLENGIIAMTGIDTRALTRHIRSKGAMRGVISTRCGGETMVEKAKGIKPMAGSDMVKKVTCSSVKEYSKGLWRLNKGFNQPEKQELHIAALDLGIKRNIIRHLCERGCKVTLFPASTPASEILAAKPDGLFLSNGPGDPGAVEGVADTINEILGKLPIFGICLGHQIFCLSQGAKTFKLKFGHRGINHPVMDVNAGNVVRITSQNHGFAVDGENLPESMEITHYSLYDNTVEGVRHKKHPAFSVQYHPEASPGPHDAAPHFDHFIEMIKAHKGGSR